MKFKKIIIFFLIFTSLFSIVYSKECSSEIPCNCGDELVSSKQLNSYDKLDFCSEFGLKIAKDNITLSCFETKITAAENRYYNSGIIILGNNITISECNISNFYNGIEIYNSSHGNITQNNLNLNYASGIKLESSNNYIIENNTINNNSWDGIFILNSDDNKIFSNLIQQNEIDGIQIQGTSNSNSIYENDLRENNGHAIAPAICNNEIRDMSNIGGNGKLIKYLENTKNQYLTGNNYSEIIFCNVENSIINSVNIDNSKIKSDGILLVNSQNITVKNSNFNNVRAGVYLYSTSNSNIYNNKFSNNDFAIRFMNESFYNFIENNIFSKSNEIIIRLDNSEMNNFFENTYENRIISFNYSENLDIKYENNGISFISNGKYDIIEKKVTNSFIKYGYIFVLILVSVIILMVLYFVYQKSKKK